MDISRRSEAFQVDDKSWLGSAHGTEATRTITLDVSTFTEADHYPNGFIPSGIAVGRITASNLYGPYDNAATDGREVLAGHIFDAVKVRTDDTTINVGAALFEHGKVLVANLPANHGTDAAGAADVDGSIIYIGTL